MNILFFFRIMAVITFKMSLKIQNGIFFNLAQNMLK